MRADGLVGIDEATPTWVLADNINAAFVILNSFKLWVC